MREGAWAWPSGEGGATAGRDQALAAVREDLGKADGWLVVTWSETGDGVLFAGQAMVETGEVTETFMVLDQAIEAAAQVALEVVGVELRSRMEMMEMED